MFKDHFVLGVQVFCWSDGSVSEFAARFLSLSAAGADCSRRLAGAAGLCGVFFQSRAGACVSAGVCFCPRFASSVRAFCS